MTRGVARIAASADVSKVAGAILTVIDMRLGSDVPLLARLVDPGVDVSAPGVDRRPVRAVARRHGELLMVLSTSRGDDKFPGGGVRTGETDAVPLAREVAEECGAQLTDIGAVKRAGASLLDLAG